MRAVQARERLDGLDAGEPLVDVHPAEERLVEAGLELVGDEKYLVLAALERLPDVAPLQPWVQHGSVLGEGIETRLLVDHLTGERDDPV